MDGAIGFVVAHGDTVDRARLSWLRTGATPQAEILANAEIGQAPDGGWPAFWGGEVASVDATCFRLAELDDLGALDAPVAARALRWLAAIQRPDGTWEEHASLAAEAPAWALPGDPEARLYLTAVAGFWLAVADAHGRPAYARLDVPAKFTTALRAAAEFVVGRLQPDGTWPSFLATGWYAAALLHDQAYFYEAARVQYVLGDRLPGMSPADVAQLAAALRRVSTGDDYWLLDAARKRLAETQRTDGGWDSDEGPIFDVHATLTAIRACR